MFVLAAFIFYALIFIARCALRAFDGDVILSYFCNLAMFSETGVTNIYFISKSDYAAVREYFRAKLGTDIAGAPWTIKFYDSGNLQRLSYLPCIKFIEQGCDLSWIAAKFTS